MEKYQMSQNFITAFTGLQKADKTVKVLEVHLMISSNNFKANAICSLYLKTWAVLKCCIRKVPDKNCSSDKTPVWWEV